MRTLSLTEAEHRSLLRFLDGLLDNETWLSAKYYEDATRTEAVTLAIIRNKLRQAKKQGQHG